MGTSPSAGGAAEERGVAGIGTAVKEGRGTEQGGTARMKASKAKQRERERENSQNPYRKK